MLSRNIALLSCGGPIIRLIRRCETLMNLEQRLAARQWPGQELGAGTKNLVWPGATRGDLS